MKKIFSFIVIVCFFNLKTFANHPFIRLDSTSLAISKSNIKNGTASKQTLIAYKKLLSDATKLLKINNPTVIDKTIFPPTDDKHDYLSISRYWWPDPTKEQGLPWMRKDGITNPETQTNAVDRKRLGLMGNGVRTLSLAYYFTDDEI